VKNNLWNLVAKLPQGVLWIMKGKNVPREEATKMVTEQKLVSRDSDLDEELAGILTAISVVSKRLQ